MPDAPKPEQPVPIDLRRELAALRAVNAPVVYFDSITSNGTYGGIGNMTLECGLHLVLDGQIMNERQVVAHLRFPLAAMANLRGALDAIELLAKPVPEGPKN
jgi:hypothetical protein